jgi:hypothetical protein
VGAGSGWLAGHDWGSRRMTVGVCN